MSSQTQLSPASSSVASTAAVLSGQTIPNPSISTKKIEAALKDSWAEKLKDKYSLAQPQLKAFKNLLSQSATVLAWGASGPVVATVASLLIYGVSSTFGWSINTINTPQYQAFLASTQYKKASLETSIVKVFKASQGVVQSHWFNYPQAFSLDTLPRESMYQDKTGASVLSYEIEVNATNTPQARQGLKLGSYDSAPNFYKLITYDNTKLELVLDPTLKYRVDGATLKKSNTAGKVEDYKFTFTKDKDNSGPYGFSVRNPYTGESKQIYYTLEERSSGGFRYGMAIWGLIISGALLHANSVRQRKRIEKNKRTLNDIFEDIEQSFYHSRGLGENLERLKSSLKAFAEINNPFTVEQINTSLTNSKLIQTEHKASFEGFMERWNEKVYQFKKNIELTPRYGLCEPQTAEDNSSALDEILNYLPQIEKELKENLSVSSQQIKKQLYQGLLYHSISRPPEEFEKIISFLKAQKVNWVDYTQHSQSPLSNPIQNIPVKKIEAQSLSYFAIHSLLRNLTNESNPIAVAPVIENIATNFLSLVERHNYPATENHNVLNCLLGTKVAFQSTESIQKILKVAALQYTPAQLSQYIDNHVAPAREHYESDNKGVSLLQGMDNLKISLEKCYLSAALNTTLPPAVESALTTPKKNKAFKL